MISARIILFMFAHTLISAIAWGDIQAINVRVCLSSVLPTHDPAIKNVLHYTIICTNGCIVSIPGTNQRLRFFSSQLDIAITPQAFYVTALNPNNVKKKKSGTKQFCHRGNRILIEPRDSHFTLGQQSFSGTLTITRNTSKKFPMLVNTVPLDEYLYAVLPYEIFQSWPHEMQKVQAVASRTYAIHHMLYAHKNNLPYDLACTNVHQNYKGHHTHDHVRDAIKETRNLIVTYKKVPALTMFDACCGGIITAHAQNSIFKYHPYLARKYVCTYCTLCGLYRWKRTILLDTVYQNLKKDPQYGKLVASIGTLQALRIGKYDNAHIVQSIICSGSQKHITLPVKRFMRHAGPKIWSACFTLTTTTTKNSHKNMLTIDGKGFGHQIGLCQHGAHALVKRGWDFKKILMFYYPGTTITRFKT